MRPAGLIAVRFCLLQLVIAANAGATPISPDDATSASFAIEEADLSSASSPAATAVMPQALASPPRMRAEVADVSPSNRAGRRFVDASSLPVAPQDRSEAAFAAARHRDDPLKGDTGATPWRDQDPLVALGRSLVNVSGGPARAAGDRSPHPQIDDGPDPFQIELDGEVRAKLLDIKQAVSDVARSVLDPHNDENGRVVFSVAGIDGLQLSSNGGAVSLGIGDTSLGSVSSAGASPGVYQGERRGARVALPGDANPIRDFIELFNSVIDSPLTWVAGGLLALGWFVFAVMSALAQRESGRGASGVGDTVGPRAAGKAIIIGSESGRGRRRRRREKPRMEGLSVRPRL
jgi:hypothetical protein